MVDYLDETPDNPEWFSVAHATRVQKLKEHYDANPEDTPMRRRAREMVARAARRANDLAEAEAQAADRLRRFGNGRCKSCTWPLEPFACQCHYGCAACKFDYRCSNEECHRLI